VRKIRYSGKVEEREIKERIDGLINMERKTITLLEGFQVFSNREICENKRGDPRVLKVSV
jgi:hypothetical protein